MQIDVYLTRDMSGQYLAIIPSEPMLCAKNVTPAKAVADVKIMLIARWKAMRQLHRDLTLFLPARELLAELYPGGRWIRTELVPYAEGEMSGIAMVTQDRRRREDRRGRVGSESAMEQPGSGRRSGDRRQLN
ncbi:hypothetical protein SAMN06265795_10927 [Noviherbaspirillum humi]|uniref:HicB_like antitoxin of toxin-antitoxin system n=1 Tax=Noviherbaspirillum humi TaxID=1688639 RepID=A0A239IAW0_9BURK|nr:hypothetical protein [Noviherbaspirillum humi]SNS90740.1 hypothetical protein SAMN06265795_10927 [Noviherbaspirillum humi]